MPDIRTWNSDEKGCFLRNIERVVELLWEAQESAIPTKFEFEVSENQVKNLKVERRYSRHANEKELRQELRGSLTILFQDNQVSGYLQRENFSPVT